MRDAGILAMHDEAAVYIRQEDALQQLDGGRWAKVAFATAFKITLLEGIEVVFIMIALDAGGAGCCCRPVSARSRCWWSW